MYRALSDLVTVRPSTVVTPWLRVLFVTNMWPDSVRPYYGTFIQTQAESLEAKNVLVDVLTIRGYVSPLAYLATPRAIGEQRKRKAYDLTHIHTGHAAAVALPVAPRPVILSYVGGDLLGHAKRAGITKKSLAEKIAFRQFARGATATITKSPEMELALPKSYRTRNHVIPNGVDLELFRPQPRNVVREEIGWDRDSLVVLFLGNPDDPLKNVDLARSAVSVLREVDPRVRLYEGWGAHPREIPTLMSAADVLALPSRSEGSPNVVKEAMAACLPIVATPVGDVPERFDGVGGCLIARPTPHEFANALMRALNVGRTEAARKAVERVSLGAVADRIITLYEKVTRIQQPCSHLKASANPARSGLSETNWSLRE